LIKTALARVQQDRLIDPSNDSAAHWFTLAKKDGNSSAALTAAIHDFAQRLIQAARTAIEQNRLTDADRLLNEAKLRDAPAAAIAELQLDVAAARSQQGREKDGQRLVGLVKAAWLEAISSSRIRIARCFYLSSLRAADPQNPSLPELSHAVQSQIVARASSLLDQGHSAEAQTTLQSALKLGGSADASALADKISRAQPAPSAVATAELKLLKPIVPHYRSRQPVWERKVGWISLTLSCQRTNQRCPGNQQHTAQSIRCRSKGCAGRRPLRTHSERRAASDADFRLRLTFKLRN